MRIISGEARGRRLVSPDGMETRPTADKTRESLFSILSRFVPGAYVLDLFGGTGALALEALSRGAEFACISDVSIKAVRAIEKNAETVLREEKSKRCMIAKADYQKAIGLFSGRMFSLVFLDPPYKMQDAYRDALERLLKAGMLSEDAVIVMEKSKDTVIHVPEELEVYDERAYRDTVIAFARFRESVE